MSNIAVLTLYYDNYQSLADLVIPNWKKYCELHNYSLIFHVGGYGPGQIGFQKIQFLYDKMFVQNEIDSALVLDLDIIFTNFNYKIEDFTDNLHCLFITKDVNGENCGSFIFNKTEKSKEVLEYILSFRDKLPNEQSVLYCHQNDLLKNNIKILEHPSINSYDYNLYPEFKDHSLTNGGQWNKNHFIFHAPGLKLEQRLDIFKSKLTT